MGGMQQIRCSRAYGPSESIASFMSFPADKYKMKSFSGLSTQLYNSEAELAYWARLPMRCVLHVQLDTQEHQLFCLYTFGDGKIL